MSKSLYVHVSVCVFVAPRKMTPPSCAACVTPGDSSISNMEKSASTENV